MKRFLCILYFLVLPGLFVSPSFSQEENLSLIAEGKYFSIYSCKNLDINELLSKLNFDYFLHFDSLSKNPDAPKNILTQTLDSLYLEVSDILDIHIYSYHGNIKILPDKNGVNSAFKKYFGRDFPQRSFYFHQKNTIYISFPDLTLGMLGHEISHAIISHYFVVFPPAKMQEILCGYVEYSLRKSTGALPK